MQMQTRHSSDPLVLPQLTPKQREVMALVADNRTSKEIAGLLGISESAVNQRIEHIRARLGGLPRGEMARLYRQQFAREQTIAGTFPPTWKKIQVHPEADSDQSSGVEGPSGAVAAMHSRNAGSGSQPSHPLLPVGLAWLSREEPLAAFFRSAAVAALVLAGMAAAATITQLVGFSVGGQ